MLSDVRIPSCLPHYTAVISGLKKEVQMLKQQFTEEQSLKSNQTEELEYVRKYNKAAKSVQKLKKELSNEHEKVLALEEKINPKLIGSVSLDQKYKDRIRLGFETVMKTLGYGYMGEVDSPAGKTGTAESFVDSDDDGYIDKETISKGFVGYAPSYNPKFSLVVLSPNVKYGSNSSYISPVNNKISSRVSNKVFEILQ